jgi:hypothetical protein
MLPQACAGTCWILRSFCRHTLGRCRPCQRMPCTCSVRAGLCARDHDDVPERRPEHSTPHKHGPSGLSALRVQSWELTGQRTGDGLFRLESTAITLASGFHVPSIPI